jgi:hypothetical protein
MTRKIRRLAVDNGHSWVDMFNQIKSARTVRNRQNQINMFIGLRGFLESQRASRFGRRQITSAERKALVSDPSILLHAIDVLQLPWRLEWNTRIASNPNQYAVARFAMLLFWYLLEPSKDPRGNNFDDFHYAFLGSFTGYLATGDEGLTDAVAQLFPGVRVFDLNSSLAAGPV